MTQSFCASQKDLMLGPRFGIALKYGMMLSLTVSRERKVTWLMGIKRLTVTLYSLTTDGPSIFSAFFYRCDNDDIYFFGFSPSPFIQVLPIQPSLFIYFFLITVFVLTYQGLHWRLLSILSWNITSLEISSCLCYPRRFGLTTH